MLALERFPRSLTWTAVVAHALTLALNLADIVIYGRSSASWVFACMSSAVILALFLTWRPPVERRLRLQVRARELELALHQRSEARSQSLVVLDPLAVWLAIPIEVAGLLALTQSDLADTPSNRVWLLIFAGIPAATTFLATLALWRASAVTQLSRALRISTLQSQLRQTEQSLVGTSAAAVVAPQPPPLPKRADSSPHTSEARSTEPALTASSNAPRFWKKPFFLLIATGCAIGMDACSRGARGIALTATIGVLIGTAVGALVGALLLLALLRWPLGFRATYRDVYRAVFVGTASAALIPVIVDGLSSASLFNPRMYEAVSVAAWIAVPPAYYFFMIRDRDGASLGWVRTLALAILQCATGVAVALAE